ncbi:MAG: phosphodiester glycosidase family protein [Saprospiraceae bacterium]|jgi:exopolysaccharide biosynthesis protein|nr:phosphodiester glycosidase family protein [Saprospiraceae bacterium]HRD81344.1 phosphodiester glycosidase family protein [Saprospiraceae bacterium]
MRIAVKIVLLLFMCLGLWPASDAQSAGLPWHSETIDKGLVWKNVLADSLYGHRQYLNLLEVDMRRFRAELVFRTDSLVRTSRQAADAGATAAVNAGFFDTKAGGSVTLMKVGGRIINVSRPKHVQEQSEILRGAWLSDRRGRAWIAAAAADSVYFSKKYYTVLLTGPLLIQNGERVALADRPFNTNRHPRTCACTTTSDTLLLLTVDGRSTESHGMSLPELTDLLLALGCRNAVNLDGGGSTTMWLAGRPFNGVVNMPSDNKRFDHEGERPVANAVVVKKRR